jgi:hypothetical protein
MAGCEEPQGQELLLSDDRRCFLIGLGFSFLFFFHFLLCFSLLSLRTRTRTTRSKETETGRTDHRLKAFCFGMALHLRDSTKLCFVYYILDACICRLGR